MANKNFTDMQDAIKKRNCGTYEEFVEEVKHNGKYFIEKPNKC